MIQSTKQEKISFKMVKMKLQDYQRFAYVGQTAPTMRTLRRLCKEKKIPNAVIEGGRWYVLVQSEELRNQNDYV